MDNSPVVDLVKQTGVSGDRLRQLLVGGGGENERASALVLGLVGNVPGFQSGSVRQLALQSASSTGQQPEGHKQQTKRTALEQKDHTLPQQIAMDQCSIQIDTQRQCRRADRTGVNSVRRIAVR
jgi:hypothetical protein